jgi:hypothetical protein
MKGNKMNLTVSRSILYTFGCIAVVLFGQLKASSQLNQFGIPPILKDRDALIAKVK